MGLFYIDTSQENNFASQNEHAKEVQSLAHESIELAKLAPNDLFPDFLWEVQLNGYEGDDYKLRGTCENPNVLRAYTIRRKYSNYWDYLDAMEAYIDYADYIESAYGSFEMMKNAADDGIASIYIPKKPKLTNKKTNKNLIKFGYVPSRIDNDFVPDSEIINDAIELIPKNEISYDKYYELPKGIAKLHSKEEEDKIKTNRVDSIYAKNTYGMQGMDAIINFLNNPNTDSIDNRGKTEASFSDAMQNLHEFDYVPQDVIDDMYTPKTTFLSSSFLMNPERQRQQEILSALTEAGFSFLDKSATGGMDKEVVRAVTKKYSNYTTDRENLTPKEIKKLKKKEAKRRKRSNERLIGDRRLQDALLRNRAHFTRDENLDFRISDVIPED